MVCFVLVLQDGGAVPDEQGYRQWFRADYFWFEAMTGVFPL